MGQEDRGRRPKHWCDSLRWRTRRRQRAMDAAADREAAAMALELRRRAWEAQAAWQRAHQDLAIAEDARQRAQQEEEEVERNGATLGHAVKAGMPFLGRLATKGEHAARNVYRDRKDDAT